jgi:hypothetical protein
MKEEGGKSGIVEWSEWIFGPWSLVRMECWSCAKLCRCVGVGGSCDPFAVWSQALVAGSLPRLFLLFDLHFGARRYRCYNNKQVTVVEVSVVVWMSWINNQTSHGSLLTNVYGEVPVL